MKRIFTLFALIFCCICVTATAQAQTQKNADDQQDAPLMETPEKPIETDGALTSPAEEIAEDTGPKARVTWERKSYKFGNVKQNVPAVCTFRFTNEGDAPLIIHNVKPSCGCTAIDYPKDTPIAPGESGEIKAEYNAKKVGSFTKSLTVKSNAEKTFPTTHASG